MTSESTWIIWLPQQHYPRYCEAVCPCLRDQWPVRHVADVKSDRWSPPRPHKWCGPPTCMCVRARGCGPRHTPGWSAAVRGSGGHRAITLTITAGENCRNQTRSIKSRTSPGKFISRELTTLSECVPKLISCKTDVFCHSNYSTKDTVTYSHKMITHKI